MRAHKRRRLTARNDLAPADLAPPTQADVEDAPSPARSAALPAPTPDHLRMPPPTRSRPHLTQDSFAQAVQDLRHTHLAPPRLPLTPPLGTPIPAAPQRPAPSPPEASAPPAPLGALAQLRQQQGPSIDQWRDTALAGVDAAPSVTELHTALVAAHEALIGLADRPVWRLRRALTLESLVEQAIARATALVVEQPQTLVDLAEVNTALQALAPDAMQAARSAYTQHLGRMAEALLEKAADAAALGYTFAALETLFARLRIGTDAPADRALRQSLVGQLWYRLLEAPTPTPLDDLARWTGRSLGMWPMRPCPQIAALVWLRALAEAPSLSVEACIAYTHQLREAWVVPEAACDTHLPAEPAFEPVARTQLEAWVVMLTHQLPSLAPFQANPIREAFTQLTDGLGATLDYELGEPETDGDAAMQARESALFIAQWVHINGRAFPGYDALFVRAATDAIDHEVAQRALVNDFAADDALFRSDIWGSSPPSGPSDAPQSPGRHRDDTPRSPDYLTDLPPTYMQEISNVWQNLGAASTSASSLDASSLDASSSEASSSEDWSAASDSESDVASTYSSMHAADFDNL